jgi:hypothetical protein
VINYIQRCNLDTVKVQGESLVVLISSAARMITGKRLPRTQTRQNQQTQGETMDEQHVYHHSDSDGARITVKVEKNTKGFNYEVAVSGAKTVDEAIELLKDAQQKLQTAYGGEAI